MKWQRPLAALAAAFFMSHALAQEEAEEAAALKRDAVSRLVQAQDPALSINIGRVYVKQAALTAARELLYEKGKFAGLNRDHWNETTPQWRLAERELMQGIDSLIQTKIADPAWLRAAWSELTSSLLDAEEADEIAVHFRTEGGALQRRVIEWFVGELTLQTYTFTDRLRYAVPGSEREMRDLQVTTYEIQSHFDPIYDLTRYPNAMRFASRDPGVKYFKMMVMQGVHAVHVHLEAVANEARAMIRARASRADPFIAQMLGETTAH